MIRTNIVIPMAGEGSRFKNTGIDTPKPLIEVDGQTLIEHSIKTLNLGVDPQYIFIIKKYDNEEYNKKLLEILDSLAPDNIKIVAEGKQHGAAYSSLLAKDYIDNDSPLIITNCDQHMSDKWVNQLSSSVNDNFHRSLYDGGIVTFFSASDKNSYAQIDNIGVTRIAEKEVISNYALTGIHYWRHGKNFVWSAEKLVEDLSGTDKEAYVSLTYNYLIEQNKKISVYNIETSDFWPLGTPEDVGTYLNHIDEKRNSEH